jgi:nucleoside-diphosphate-sugar epimerase
MASATTLVSMDESMEGKSVLVTGVTGFIGKVIVEKLLFEFPNIKRIYVMLRGKKANPPKTPRGLSAADRFQDDVLNSPIWDLRLRRHGEETNAFHDRIKTRVTAIEGSLGEKNCSISDGDCEESTCVIHFLHSPRSSGS